MDRAEELKVGSGKLDIYASLKGLGKDGALGATVDYQHRVSKNVSAFATGWGGLKWGQDKGLGYEAIGGLRWRF